MSDKTYELIKQIILEWPLGTRQQLAADLGAAWNQTGPWCLQDIKLISDGGQKIQCIKLIRELTRLGLKEAKELSDNLPAMIHARLLPEEAERFKREFERLGATVELVPWS